MKEVTLDQYTNSVVNLSKLAQDDTSGSRAAAQVLLSAYNGNEWQLDITDLCLLDHAHYEDAFIVILGRTSLNIEPHTVLDKGSDIFNSLWCQWSYLHVCERGKQQTFTA